MDSAATSLLANGPSKLAVAVIDIDGTFFIQAGIFIVLVLVLHPLLFKPWLAAQARRSEAIGGALAKAKTLRADADGLVADYERGLDQARERAISERANRRHEVEAEQGSKLAQERASAMATLTAERERLATEAEQARSGLAGKVGELAADISNRLLGRPQ